MVGFAIIHQRDVGRTVRQCLLIQSYARNTAANSGVIVD